MAKKECANQVDLVVLQRSGDRIIVRGCDPATAGRESQKIAGRDEVQNVSVRGHVHGRNC